MAKTTNPAIEPLLFIRRHCAVPGQTPTGADIKALMDAEFAGAGTATATADRCHIRHFNELNFTKAVDEIISNDSDSCGVGEVCSDTFFAHGGNFTLLKCETDVAFIERVNALSILLGYEYELVGDCYVAQQTKSSSGCYFDMIVLKCNPLDRENPITAKLVYKARIDTGAEILEDCSKLERTKEYRNTEIPFTVPDAYIYDQIYGANDLDAIKAFYCDKTPQALLDQVVSGATPLTVSPQTVPVAKKETEAKTQDKKSK